jgi:urease accessory protein
VLEVGPGGSIAELRRGPRLAPRILGRAAGAVRAAFVPTQAGPLAGDQDRVRIVVRAGATLIVEPVAATLALPGAARTLLALDVTVEAGGRLVLDEAPLIVAFGADVERRCVIELGAGAVAALRETVVLGRDGERPGTLVSSLRATLDERPLLHDGLRLRDGDAHAALAPGHRVVSTVSLLGLRPPPANGGLELDGAGALLRASGPALAAVERAAEGTWRAWNTLAVGHPRAEAHVRPVAATRSPGPRPALGDGCEHGPSWWPSRSAPTAVPVSPG